MAETPNAWTDNATLAGIAGLATAAGAVLKTVFDWRKDKGKERTSSEDLVRDDLLAMLREARTETESLRRELADARRELREHAAESARRLSECEDRAVRFFSELTALKGKVGDLERRQWEGNS